MVPTRGVSWLELRIEQLVQHFAVVLNFHLFDVLVSYQLLPNGKCPDSLDTVPEVFASKLWAAAKERGYFRELFGRELLIELS
jgi:hypothetical protein